MGYSADILADSISPAGVRLTSLIITFPRPIAPQVLTHRGLSRNAQSSRARPLRKSLAGIRANPWVPESWGSEQSGMQASAPLTGQREVLARLVWKGGLYAALGTAYALGRLGVHKQIANRPLEPFMWHTMLISATDWDNFLALREHDDAQPEIATIARLIREALENSVPHPKDLGEWHLPLVTAEEWASPDGPKSDWERWVKISVGRCARVSYLTHDGRRDPAKDIELHDRLLASWHLSPFEHAATPLADGSRRAGNFRGWWQARKDVLNEDDFSKAG